MKKEEHFKLLTFYKFVDVKNPETEVEDHLEFCTNIGMKGRIYIGNEGISSTVTGNVGQIKAYKLYLNNHELWKDIPDLDIKASDVDGHKFPRMQVKYREEIVVLGQKYTSDEVEQAGNRMSIEELKDLIDNGDPESYVILDMRNNHEYELGHFKGAVPANTPTFRELEKQIEDYKEQFGDKKIISYCTGGIRCEKSTVMMQKAGLKNTYQLDGGVVKYINSFNDGNWLGNLYVFDDRVSQKVGDENTHTTIGKCLYSGKKTDTCENCRYSPCNARIIVDSEEYEAHMGFCSSECAAGGLEAGLVKDMDFDSMNYKRERIKMKEHPELSEEILKKIRTHINTMLNGVEFNHQKTQKEDFIMD